MVKIKFSKMKYDDLDEQTAKAVLKYSSKDVEIDDKELTTEQIKKFKDWMEQEGYKLV